MSAAAAAAEIPEGTPAPKIGMKKLILVGVVALLVLAIAGGGVFWWLKKRAAHAAALAEEEGGGKSVAEHKIDISHPPTFLPLDPFVVNLADRDADRYAQIGITLELESPAFAEQVKSFMPAVRNAILMVIAHKTARELIDRPGKEDLADEIMREAGKPMGIDIDPPLRIREVAAAKVEPTPIARVEGAEASASRAASASASAPASAATPASALASAPAASVAEAAATPASASASSPATRVAVVAAPERGDKPRLHGDSTAGPIRHVHFSSFIIQ
jgi:flagellar FliL protein